MSHCHWKKSTLDITVVKSSDVINRIEISSYPNKLSYDVDDKLDLSGLVVNLTYQRAEGLPGFHTLILQLYN